MIKDNSDFGEFWNQYPRKQNRKNAVLLWLTLSTEDRALALQALPRHVKAWALEGRAKDKILDPVRWLSGARWEDEIDTAEHIPAKAFAWWATDQGVLKRGAELGISPRAGESAQEFKARVVEAARRAA